MFMNMFTSCIGICGFGIRGPWKRSEIPKRAENCTFQQDLGALDSYQAATFPNSPISAIFGGKSDFFQALLKPLLFVNLFMNMFINKWTSWTFGSCSVHLIWWTFTSYPRTACSWTFSSCSCSRLKISEQESLEFSPESIKQASQHSFL